VSHFVLRLAYCRTEELRRWLLAQECALFQARFREELSDVQVPPCCTLSVACMRVWMIAQPAER